MKQYTLFKNIVVFIAEKYITKKIYYNKPRIISNIEDNEPISKQFYCKKCHILVTVTNIKDRRKKFCSPHCEKLYWKHPKLSTS